METDSHREIARALAEILHEDLAEEQTVTVPGWGTFTIEHETARSDNTRAGATALHPPKDTVEFEPEHA